MDDDLLNELIDHLRGQLGEVRIFLRQHKKLLGTVSVFLIGG